MRATGNMSVQTITEVILQKAYNILFISGFVTLSFKVKINSNNDSF